MFLKMCNTVKRPIIILCDLFKGGSASIVKSQHNDVHMSGSDSDSARTSSSSGARRKTSNTHRAQGVK